MDIIMDIVLLVPASFLAVMYMKMVGYMVEQAIMVPEMRFHGACSAVTAAFMGVLMLAGTITEIEPHTSITISMIFCSICFVVIMSDYKVDEENAGEEHAT